MFMFLHYDILWLEHQTASLGSYWVTWNLEIDWKQKI